MQPLSYFGIGRGSVLDIKLYSNENEDDFVEIENHFVSGDEVDITDYIPIDQSYLDDPSDFFEKEDVKLETKEEPKTIWVSVNELKGRNLMLFRFINPEISTNDLKHKIVEEARRRAENIGHKKHLGFDDFKLLSDGAVMVSDDSIGDYLDNKMQKKLDVEVYLTLRGGGKHGVMRGIVKGKNNKKEFYKKIENDVCASIPSMVNSCQLTESIGSVLTYLRTFTGSKEVLFKQAMSSLSKEELVSSKVIMEAFGKFGSTEDKVEKICRKFMGKHIEHLDQHIEQLEGLKTGLISTINRHYAEWLMKDTGKFDNQPFIKMIDDLLADLDGGSVATDDQLASILNGMHLTQ